MTNTPSQCGCSHGFNEYNKLPANTDIRFCKLHALAPRMFELLKVISVKELIDQYDQCALCGGRENHDKNCCWEEARQIIAEIEEVKL